LYSIVKLSDRDQKLLSAERLKATGRLASEIAHELNTPLGGILMYSHLLLEELSDGDPSLENVVKINKLAHRCKMIVQGLLEFANEDRPRRSLVQINEVVHNVIGFMEDHVLLRGISVKTRLDPNLPRIKGVENKLEQVFINLITNAAQSMNGTGKLCFETAFLPVTNQVRIECSDTGCGIEEGHQDRVFEPFFTTKDKGTGTGLGLSICHGIIEQHRGTITIQSSAEQGTVFTIFLPSGEEVT
jgi:signal transduction histidine kinase